MPSTTLSLLLDNNFLICICAKYSDFEASNNTIATVTYDDWLTRTGPISHEVKMIVTPNVIVSTCMYCNYKLTLAMYTVYTLMNTECSCN